MFRSIETRLGSLIMLGALLLFLSGMVFRLTSSPLSGGWVSEVSIYLVAWGLLLSAAGCVATNEHVRADFFLQLMGPKFRYIANILASAAGLAFCSALTWFGFQVVEFSLAWDERGPSYLQIPTAWFYAALPVSMAACSLRYLMELWRHIRAKQET
ncbi:MAG: TRAP transporter small permease [Hyphomicrobiales bacterium]|nr:TRAP transporter small permease [Hyphomicrobiales bacterium]